MSVLSRTAVMELIRQNLSEPEVISLICQCSRSFGTALLRISDISSEWTFAISASSNLCHLVDGIRYGDCARCKRPRTHRLGKRSLSENLYCHYVLRCPLRCPYYFWNGLYSLQKPHYSYEHKECVEPPRYLRYQLRRT
jgi:hypothetical protein